LDLMSAHSFYAHMIRAISHWKKLVGFAFVNDTNLCVHGPHIHSQNVNNAMQQLVDNWEGLLRATGGALVPSKCFWYLIDFQLKNGRWHYVTKQQVPGEVAVYDDARNRITIPRLEAHEAR